MSARATAFSAFLAARGVRRSLDERLLDAMADAATARLAPVGTATVARDVAALSGLDGDAARALSILVLATALVTREGSTRLLIPGDSLDALTTEIVGKLGAAGAGVVAALSAPHTLLTSAAGVVGAPRSDRPLLWDGSALAPARLYRAEEDLARALLGRAPRPLDASRALADVVALPTRAPDGAPTALTDEQARAVAAGCEGGLTVITGGPGTGKTSVLVALLRALVRCGVAPDAIALAAPTGKAAERMTESTRRALGTLEAPSREDVALGRALPQARTLHRLLGYSPTRRAFSRGPDDPLPHEVVVVDEASMVDVELGRALALALADRARLVLLGDPEQLPSVGAGALLSDVAAALPERVSRLTVSHRMRASDPSGAAVLQLSRQIAAGAVDTSAIAVRAHAKEITWRGVERLDASRQDGLLDLLAERHVDEIAAPLAGVKPLVDGGLDQRDTEQVLAALHAAQRVRLLSPVHAGPLGTLALSRGVADRVA
ncbi:MAG: AAA family ATPase, partial [Polyangiaceae bacterium]|nr:AAA family ATPase [Polyangiaceae bacterium]